MSTYNSQVQLGLASRRKPYRAVVSVFRTLMAAGTLTAVLSLLAGISSAQIASHSSGWVVISVDAYRSLRARAFPMEHEPAKPPVEATLTRVDYDLRVGGAASGGELASGRVSLTIDVLKDGWVRVPIPAGLLVREAKLDGKLVSLVPSESSKGGSQLCALLSRAGRSTLLLDIALPITSAAGQESVSLPSTASGVTRATVQLPRQGVEVKLTGGLLSEKSENATESKWVAFGRGNEVMRFTWRRKTEDHRLTQALRTRGSLVELLGLGEDSTSISTEVNLEVTQGIAREVRLQVPENVTVNQVLGAMVADWEMKGGELAVTFLEPVEKNGRLVITAETRSPREGRIDVPLLRLIGAERETGGVAVEVLGAGEIKDTKTEGLEDADATDLGEMVSSRESPSLAAFKFRPGSMKTARALAVNVSRYTPQAVLMANIEEARYQVLASKEGKTLVQARYAVRNNSRNFLKVTLPSGATLWSASLSGKPVRPGQSPDGGLLLPLEKTRAGEEAAPFAVEVLYLSREAAWSEKGQMKVPLPALDLPVSRTGLLVYHPPLFKLTPEPGAFRAQTYEEPSSSALNETLGIQGPAGSGGVPASSAPSPAEAGKDFNAAAQVANQAVLDRFRAKSQSGKVTGILPVLVLFPSVGPSIYLVSELTAESQAPKAQLSYQRDKKAGGK